ncbi:MAG: hypothetical protein LBF42_01515 [Puniceicoccales bacterium]|nr:hypothetical protein [Puniceicoccales bacterium]
MNFEIKLVQSPGLRWPSPFDFGQEDEMEPKNVQATTKVKSEYECEYEVSSEEEDGVPVGACRTEDTESSETNRSASETESEELEKEESVGTLKGFNIFNISNSYDSFAKEPEAKTTYIYETRGILPGIAEGKEKPEASQGAVFFKSSDLDGGGPLSETNRTNLTDENEPIADSEPKTFPVEDFTELLGKMKDLYRYLQGAKAVGKRHMNFVAELEKRIAFK